MLNFFNYMWFKWQFWRVNDFSFKQLNYSIKLIHLFKDFVIKGLFNYYKMNLPKVGPVFVYVGENKKKRNIKAVVVKPLNMMYLSKTNDRPEFPIKGIMMGQDRRCFVNLICRIGSGNSVYVNFLLDSSGFLIYFIKCI